MDSYKQLQEKLFAPIDASSLTIFRIGFGFIMLWDMWRYYHHGWIERYYIEPSFYFKYYGFEWVQPWPGDGMYIHFAIMAVLAFMILIGCLYRLSTILFTLAFSYMFLLDQTRYLNHFYMVILFSILLCVIPAHKQFSIDAWLRPKLRSVVVPAWTVWVLRIQMEIILIYAGVVKINPDWLRLQPLSMWLESRSDFPVLGTLFMQDWSVAVAAYGIILLHIVGAPLLLWKKTRLYVFCLYAAFHILNHFVFNIGIFPWFTLFASLLFFDPDWPKQFWSRIENRFRNKTVITQPHKTPSSDDSALRHSPIYTHLTISFLGLWILSQLLIPVRHLLYPGNVSWTEEGHRFSWQMKLRDKVGKARFYVLDKKSGERHRIDPSQYLTRKQIRKMTTRPDMLLQFAHHLAQEWKQSTSSDVEVRAQVYVSLNGRRPALLLDPERDLATIKRDLSHANWIVPLTEPFRWIDRNS